jgi:hypothetical protein
VSVGDVNTKLKWKTDMNQQDIIKKSGPHRWRPGESGNANGRPVGSRQKIAERVLSVFKDIVDTDAAEASLRALMTEDPGKFWTIAAGLLPREVEAKLSVQTQSSVLSPDDMAIMREVLMTIRRAAPGAGQEAVMASLETWLRSDVAQPVASAAPAIAALPAPSQMEVLPLIPCPVPLPRSSE